ncbi:PrsW family intramembrane metalloprotease [Nocardioides coralli]|uniref:PrsW family intramembrane metalloprotease n=1 Tax=Nocardioides coralli TaxID=2872154 RepID=UPI001CA40183|nr:PrsW family intramembrane metalloprotease [Nocardioides coralli]QZY28318.1 PrsW family intramembrane metalloprotease [Nocardioides coralli]
MPGARRDSVAFTVLVTVLVLLGALPVLVVIAASGAPSSLLLATVLAALPVGPLVAAYLWLDRYEPEPRRLLLSGLLWGGFVATAAALLVQGIGGIVVGFTDRQSLAVVAPVTEELAKGAFLVLLLWWRRHELDGILDGIVYAGMVGIGFAFVENILYLAAAYNGTDGMGPGGTEALTTVFILRCLVSPFAHPLFTTFIGIGVGIAVGSRSGAVRLLAPLAGYVVAVLAHGLWNGSTLFGFAGFAGVYVVLMAPAFFGLVGFAVWARRSERRMLTAALGDAAQRGFIPATDIPWLVDLRARRASRQHARQVGGESAHRAMLDYQQAAVELGFLHHRYLRGTPPPGFAARGQAHVDRINAARPYVAFPGQVVPTR